mmetsp:Transcript_146627/g.470476  ORF Transcript_146627/g.470476 Transcript_146627/m.470476 type:complete len:204 (+) Transcript_146627:256-867(+)
MESAAQHSDVPEDGPPRGERLVVQSQADGPSAEDVFGVDRWLPEACAALDGAREADKGAPVAVVRAREPGEHHGGLRGGFYPLAAMSAAAAVLVRRHGSPAKLRSPPVARAPFWASDAKYPSGSQGSTNSTLTPGSEASDANRHLSGSQGSTNSTLTHGSYEDEAPGTGGAAGAAASGLDLGASAAAGLGLGAAGVRRLIVSL